jgi:hypothetical protein
MPSTKLYKAKAVPRSWALETSLITARSALPLRPHTRRGPA